MPFPTTRIIPAGWSAHHAGHIATAANATVTVRYQDGEPTYDPVTDDTTASFVTVHAGPALINPASARGIYATEQAADTLTGSAYTVQLDHDAAGILPGHQVHVDTAPNDPDLAGADLYVIGPLLGSERFSRVLLCSTSTDDVP